MAALVLPLLQLLVQRQAVQLIDDARRFGGCHHLRRGGGDAFVGFGARGGHDGRTNHRAGDRTIYWMGKRARAVKHAFHRGFDRCRIVILRQRQRVTRLHAVARFKPANGVPPGIGQGQIHPLNLLKQRLFGRGGRLLARGNEQRVGQSPCHAISHLSAPSFLLLKRSGATIIIKSISI